MLLQTTGTLCNCAAHVFTAQPANCNLVHRLFSEETGAKGKRVFIVTTHAEFWRRYQNIVPLHRHMYEVICEGAPCHLYFGEVPWI